MKVETMLLVLPSASLSKAYDAYIKAWEMTGEHYVPYAAGPRGMTFEALLDDWEIAKTDQAYERGFVPATLYFMLDSKNEIVGALHLRHVLNEALQLIGGHIGYGVRPDARKRGIAKHMLALGLEKAAALDIQEVLLTCDDDNAASFHTMIANGCVLKDTITVEGKRIRRYIKALK
jgi:predicted acetyltransferase